MRNDLTIDTSTGALLNVSRVNVDENSLYINGTEVPSSSWTGTGSYTTTIGGVTFTINKIVLNEGNITLIKNSDTNFTMSKTAGSEVVPTKFTFGYDGACMRNVGKVIAIEPIAPHGDIWARIEDLPVVTGYTCVGISGYRLYGAYCTMCTLSELSLWGSSRLRFNLYNTTDYTTGNLTLTLDLLYIRTS